MSNKILHSGFQLLRKLSYRIKAGNVILFESINDFDGSSLEVYNYLKNNGYDKKYKLIWAVKNFDNLKNKNFRSIKYVGHSIRNLYFENRAKYVFFEDLPPFSKKKSDATVIYLSHGCPTIKDTHNHIHAGALCDYCICTSEDAEDLICTNFNVKKEQLFISSLPRNDALFCEEKELPKLTEKSFDKVIIWTPTFRKTNTLDDGGTNGYLGLPLISTKGELELINACAVKNNVLIIIKMHPRVFTDSIGRIDYSNIIILSDNEMKKKGVKLYSLFNETDALISDYSSVSFDYMLLNKPLAYVTSDMEEYRRGFAMSNVLEYMPGSKINNTDDFLLFIDDIKNNTDRFKAEREKISSWANKYNDPYGAKRVCEMFID